MGALGTPWRALTALPSGGTFGPSPEGTFPPWCSPPASPRFPAASGQARSIKVLMIVLNFLRFSASHPAAGSATPGGHTGF